MKILELRGTPYEMGVQTGREARAAVVAMCTTYLDHVVLEFFDADTKKNREEVRRVKDTVSRRAMKQFNPTLPELVLDEMRGIVKGASHKDVTMPRLFAINFGIDILLAMAYDKSILEYIPRDKIHIPDMCNVRMFGRYYMRDYQFPNGHAFNRFGGLIARYPENGCLPTVSVAAPGMIGGVTVMNSSGMTVGCNLLRSSGVDRAQMQQGITTKLRGLAEVAWTTHGTMQVLRDFDNGCPWIVTCMDSEGDQAAWEISSCVLHERRTGYRSKPSANAPPAFKSWEEEMAFKDKVGNDYVPRLPRDDGITVTNFAVVPEVRKQQQTKWINFLERGSKSPVWRYTEFVKHSPTTVRQAKNAVQYLSPGRGTGFTKDPVIAGSVSVSDPAKRTMWTKIGRWSGKWTKVQWKDGRFRFSTVN